MHLPVQAVCCHFPRTGILCRVDNFLLITLVAFVILAFSHILYPHFMGINRLDLAIKLLHILRDCNYIPSDFLFLHVKPSIWYVLARRTLSLLGIATRFGNKLSLDRHSSYKGMTMPRIWHQQMESREGSGS